MLLLGRGEGEAIYLGRFVTITVLRVEARAVRVGIEAPTRIAISKPGTATEKHLADCRRLEASGLDDDTLHTFEARKGDVIQIGRDVRFQIFGIANEVARIGIDAPPHMAVSRNEFSREAHMRFQEQREAKEAARSVV